MLVALRGNVILYQGEELGLLQDEIPFEQLQDPEAIANWPLTLSRDGARTPLPWVAQDQHGGFTSGTPWLPLSAANLARAIDRQEGDPASLLHHARAVLALRRAHPALRLGGLSVTHADAGLLVLRRELEGAVIEASFNLGTTPLSLAAHGTVLLAVNGATPVLLPPYGALIAQL